LRLVALAAVVPALFLPAVVLLWLEDEAEDLDGECVVDDGALVCSEGDCVEGVAEGTPED
jgi:hypothetical protein